MRASGAGLGSETERGVRQLLLLTLALLCASSLFLVPLCPSVLSLCPWGCGRPGPSSKPSHVFPGKRINRALQWPRPIPVSPKQRVQGRGSGLGRFIPKSLHPEVVAMPDLLGVRELHLQAGVGVQLTPARPLQWSGPWWTQHYQGRNEPLILDPEGSQPPQEVMRRTLGPHWLSPGQDLTSSSDLRVSGLVPDGDGPPSLQEAGGLWPSNPPKP